MVSSFRCASMAPQICGKDYHARAGHVKHNRR
jgi:hypothetical protein